MSRGLVTFGPLAACSAQAHGRRHGFVVVEHHRSLPDDRPPGDFDDVVIDGCLLGPIGESRPAWIDEVDRVYVATRDIPDPFGESIGPVSRGLKRAVDVVGALAALAKKREEEGAAA